MQVTRPLLVGAAALAELLQVSERHVATMRADGLLPEPKQLGSRTVRWSVAEIEDWIAAGCPPRNEWNECRLASGGA